MSSKIDVGGKGYAFSIFKDKGCRKGFKSYYTPGHGRGYEPQNIFMCYYKGAHGRNARPFMSFISNENDLGGFTFIVLLIEALGVLGGRESAIQGDFNFWTGLVIVVYGGKLCHTALQLIEICRYEVGISFIFLAALAIKQGLALNCKLALCS